MTMLVEYTGRGDYRQVTAADFARVGLTHATVTFNKANGYEIALPDDVALYLVAQDDFQTSQADSFVEVLDRMFEGSDPPLVNPAAGIPGLRTLGTGAGEAAPGTLAAVVDSKEDEGAAAAAQAAAVQRANHTGFQAPSTISGTAVVNADSRLSNTRIPTDGSVTAVKVSSSLIDPVAATPGLRTIGPGSQQAAPGNIASISYGLLAARPPANTFLAGHFYVATDENGGQTYVTDGIATWSPTGAPVLFTKRLALAQLATNAVGVACTTAGVFYRVPELSVSFVQPSTSIARILIPELISLANVATTVAPTCQIRYSKDAWATSYPAALGGAQNWATGSTIEGWRAMDALIPPGGAAGGAVVSPGDTVAVGFFMARGADAPKTVTILSNPTSGFCPFILAVAE